MIEKLPNMLQLIKQLQHVPYLASKNMYKVVNHLLSIDQEKAQQLCTAILMARENITQCVVCCVWKEKKQSCYICSDTRRDHTIICVVETWQELISIEKTGGYQGLYHVLGGAISPLEGVSPDDLSIDLLIKQIGRASCRDRV